MPKCQPLNGISIVSVVFAQNVRVTNTQTDRYTDRPRYVRHLKQRTTSMHRVHATRHESETSYYSGCGEACTLACSCRLGRRPTQMTDELAA